MKNYNTYLKGMEKGIQEKLFFAEHLDLDGFDFIIDFGCANGYVASKLKHLTYTPILGVDYDPEMRKIATQNGLVAFANINKLPKLDGKKVLVLFSSVLHEVGDYWQTLKKWLKEIKPVIVIRDMIAPNLDGHEWLMDYQPTGKEPKWKEYEEEWGEIKTTHDLYYYFLKYTYVDNWETEVKKNYFSVPWGDIHALGEIIYSNSYILQYKKNKLKRL